MPLWLNVMYVNATKEKQSKHQAHSNHFQFPLLFSRIFLWISLWAYLNAAINQSSWWSLMIFPNMFIFVLFNSPSPHPQWLKFSWIISSNFMACLILMSLTRIPRSPTIFGKNCSSYRAPNYISAPPIYHPHIDGQTEIFNKCLVTYLWCFSSNRQHQWAQWLPLVEWWYNTSYLIATRMTPFEAVYEQNPSSVLSYMSGVSKVHLEG
jgi:hypothetical protein